LINSSALSCCVVQTADRLNATDSLINGLIYPPDCRYTMPEPGRCDCGRQNSCGRPSFGLVSQLMMVDAVDAFKCFEDVNRFGLRLHPPSVERF